MSSGSFRPAPPHGYFSSISVPFDKVVRAAEVPVPAPPKPNAVQIAPAKVFRPRHEPVTSKRGEGLVTQIVVMVIVAIAFGGLIWHDCNSSNKDHSHRIR